MLGRLILCASPIGNLGDASPRLAETLAGCDLVFCEDTRRTRILLDHLGLKIPLRSYFAGNEATRAPELETALSTGQMVGLITDAGTPAISDPGVSAVGIARRLGAKVTVVPGPSAMTAALAVSGFPTERVAFEGFLPKRGRERADRLAAISADPRTVVLFVGTNQLTADLSALAQLTPDRPTCVARELTKKFEEVEWSTCAEAAEQWQQRTPRGEFTIVLSAFETTGKAPRDLLDSVDALTATGVSLSEAVRRVSIEQGVSRRSLYQEALSRNRGTSSEQ